MHEIDSWMYNIYSTGLTFEHSSHSQVYSLKSSINTDLPVQEGTDLTVS